MQKILLQSKRLNNAIWSDLHTNSRWLCNNLDFLSTFFFFFQEQHSLSPGTWSWLQFLYFSDLSQPTVIKFSSLFTPNPHTHTLCVTLPSLLNSQLLSSDCLSIRLTLTPSALVRSSTSRRRTHIQNRPSTNTHTHTHTPGGEPGRLGCQAELCFRPSGRKVPDAFTRMGLGLDLFKAVSINPTHTPDLLLLTHTCIQFFSRFPKKAVHVTQCYMLGSFYLCNMVIGGEGAQSGPWAAALVQQRKQRYSFLWSTVLSHSFMVCAVMWITQWYFIKAKSKR